MSLAPGVRLGPYEVIAQIGVGGMGEVWRATDTNLKRAVAIKVLPEAVAADRDRLARFQREAEVLAALNHPNIAHIHGLEKSGGTTALVMELVEGPTLADRIARGPLPVDEALAIAKQIAEALEAAHEQGIVHRDLKPANVKVREDGTVKVLDFGLAKAVEPAGASSDMSRSPTITSPAMTQMGMILGTAAYMSPEQAKGRAVDKRTDIWAFGVVLYEMLTGRRPFDGEDMTEVLGAVVRLDPTWEALPADVPPAIRTLLQRCLVKDSRRRVADVAAALFVLEHQAAPPPTALVVPPGRIRTSSLAAGIAGAFILAGLAAAVTWLLTRSPTPDVVRTTIATSGTTALAVHGADSDIAITQDGSRVVYRGTNQLVVRTLNQLEPAILSGLGSPRGVFLSPDGQWVGYFDGINLQKVSITGGAPVTITQALSRGSEGPRGATWGDDGTIIFATNARNKGLQRVSSSGGEPAVLTVPDAERGENEHVWPEFLPGGKSVLYTITPRSGIVENSLIAMLDLETGTSKPLFRGGSHARYVPTGHLVYGLAGTLRAVAFDLARLEVVGTAVTVVEGIMTSAASGSADMALARNGSLVYVSNADSDSRGEVTLVDRQGHPNVLPGMAAGGYRDVRVSPDGARLALTFQNDIWIYDMRRTTMTQLTRDPAQDKSPLWTPDGQRIIFTSRRRGYAELFVRAADGTGSDEPFLERGKDLVDLRANAWSADKTRLLIVQVGAGTAIGEIPIDRPSEFRQLVDTDSQSPVSPDGWIAYEAGLQIYVERYPQLRSRQPISNDRRPATDVVEGRPRAVLQHSGRPADVRGRRAAWADVNGGTSPAAVRVPDASAGDRQSAVRRDRRWPLRNDSHRF